MSHYDKQREEAWYDSVNYPKHYNSHPSGLECIQITEHMSFCIGNVMKYIWRSDHKNGLEDLKKAQWYLTREIELREKKDLSESKTNKLQPLDTFQKLEEKDPSYY